VKNLNKEFFVHFCTWFETHEKSQRWSMWESLNEANPHNPEVILNHGLRDIASTEYPLIGPYQSDDPMVIAYQFQLMKLAGIDGIIVDWDGQRINPKRHEMLLNIIPFLMKYQLKLIVCFEEWAGYYPEGIFQNRQEEIAAVISELAWLQNNVMNQVYYAEYYGKKPLIIFRKVPNKHLTQSEWRSVKNSFHLNQTDYIFPNPYETNLNNISDGWFFWIGGFDHRGVNTMSFLAREWDLFSKQCKQNSISKYFIPSIVPGFNDTPVWGWGDGARIAPRYNHQRFEWMWQKALETQAPFAQIVTWNDWNEGSQIEPSLERGVNDIWFTYCQIQKYRKQTIYFTKEDFNIPYQVFKSGMLISHPDVFDARTLLRSMKESIKRNKNEK
jgi:hypothetical protein